MKGGRPSYETCDFALSWWIKQGRAGAIDLADLKVVMVGRWQTTPGDPWDVTLYVDDRATPAQRDALAAVFLGRAGGAIAKGFAAQIVEVHAVKTAATRQIKSSDLMKREGYASRSKESIFS